MFPTQLKKCHPSVVSHCFSITLLCLGQARTRRCSYKRYRGTYRYPYWTSTCRSAHRLICRSSSSLVGQQNWKKRTVFQPRACNGKMDIRLYGKTVFLILFACCLFVCQKCRQFCVYWAEILHIILVDSCGWFMGLDFLKILLGGWRS